MTLAPRVVVVHRRPEVEELLARHGSRGAAAYFLAQRGRSLDDLDRHAAALAEALATVAAAVPAGWRHGRVERADLSRFLFAPDDLVVVVGPDGLVANAAKYLDGQPVLGVDPEPGVNPGVLLPLRAGQVADRLQRVAAGTAAVEHRTMVEAAVDDTQRLCALNEVYLGHPGHQSARWTLAAPDGRTERQSSSGLIVGTGTGATGWCRSLTRQRRVPLEDPAPDEARLLWLVREAWPSPFTGAEVTEGHVAAGQALQVTCESDGLVAFGDGIESDRIVLAWGQTVTLGIAARRLTLVR